MNGRKRAAFVLLALLVLLIGCGAGESRTMGGLKRGAALLLALFLLPAGSGAQAETFRTSGERWTAGFGRAEITVSEDELDGMYIAGYNQGWRPTGILDQSTAWAVWLETGGQSALLIGVDCIALGSDTVAEIRARVASLHCGAVNVYATHSHAGVDTLGLWGPTAVDGKHESYQERLIDACVRAATEAKRDRRAGVLRYGSVETDPMYLKDSRDPQVFDARLRQLRFVPDDGSAGVRLYQYGAHAEALRGSNTLLSRDFPGALCDEVEAQTGDRAAFVPGAVGGLIMTREIAAPAAKNMQATGQMLARYALSIGPEQEAPVEPLIGYSRAEAVIPLDNTAFLFYQFLGILKREVSEAESATGYALHTEVSVLRLGHLTLALIPGEIFPELVWGGARGNEADNPRPLAETAEAYGVEELLIVGLANDEIGYIVPPSDFLVNEEAPYLKRIRDVHGEDHYEETNSVGPETAKEIERALEAALAALGEME